MGSCSELSSNHARFVRFHSILAKAGNITKLILAVVLILFTTLECLCGLTCKQIYLLLCLSGFQLVLFHLHSLSRLCYVVYLLLKTESGER